MQVKSMSPLGVICRQFIFSNLYVGNLLTFDRNVTELHSGSEINSVSQMILKSNDLVFGGLHKA